MTCCSHCAATDAHFGREAARRDLERYERRGPDDTTGAMISQIRSAGAETMTLLDIGGGIGVLHHELMDDVVSRTVHVEAASAYIEASREEDARRGRSDRVDYVAGDATELAGELEPAEIVALDRVICCYPDWRQLLETTAHKTTRLYAFSVPRNRWFVKLGVALENFVRRLKRNPFRTFAHPVEAMHDALAGLGFKRRRVDRTFVWHVALYERSD